MTPIHVLGISGSLRQGSYNTGLLRAAAELRPAGLTLEIYSIADIPLYSNDVELAGIPEPVQDFKARIRVADGLIIAAPEYNYSIPGVLKNALDWASRPPKENPFNGKPLAIMGASGGQWGTARCQYHLRQVAVGLNLLTMNRPEILVPSAGQKFGADGNLTDQETRERIRVMLEAFAEWVRRLRTP